MYCHLQSTFPFFQAPMDDQIIITGFFWYWRKFKKTGMILRQLLKHLFSDYFEVDLFKRDIKDNGIPWEVWVRLNDINVFHECVLKYEWVVAQRRNMNSDLQDLCLMFLPLHLPLNCPFVLLNVHVFYRLCWDFLIFKKILAQNHELQRSPPFISTPSKLSVRVSRALNQHNVVGFTLK